MKHSYRQNYNLGYHMGMGHFGEAVSIPNKENWYAFFVSVVAGKSVDQSLTAFGLRTQTHTMKSEARFKTIAAAAYTLKIICGMPHNDVAQALQAGVNTTRDAVKYYRRRED